MHLADAIANVIVAGLNRVESSQLKKAIGYIGESLLLDSILSVTSTIPYDRAISYSSIMTKLTNTLASEILFKIIESKLDDKGMKIFEKLVKNQNDYTSRILSKTIANYTPANRMNLLPIVLKMSRSGMHPNTTIRKVLGSEKAKKALIDEATSICLKLRPVLDSILDKYNEYANVFAFESGPIVKGKTQTIMVKSTGPVKSRENYMRKSPGELIDMDISIPRNTNSAVIQSIETVVNMPFTFDAEYNGVIQELVKDDFYRVLIAGKSTNEAAINAKLEQSLSNIEEGINYWNEVGQGNVYFNYVVDFRGRISQRGGLSAVGGKTEKSMLRSGVAHKLGETGYDSILIALAGSMGHDKETFTARLEWAKENVDTHIMIGKAILDDAVSGFKALKELGPDDIFDAAVISIELYRISQFEGNLEDYKSNIFVGYDATSSAVQLVGLIMGNETLTEASNCRVGKDTDDKIHDSYMLVADIMDVAAPKLRDESNTHLVDMWLSFNAKTKRAIAKPLLMTRLYGSKFRTHMEAAREVAIDKGIIDASDNKLVRDFGVFIARLFNNAFDNEAGFNALRSYEDYTKRIANAYSSVDKLVYWEVQDNTSFNNQTVVSTYKKYAGQVYFSYREGKKRSTITYGLNIIEDCKEALDYKEEREIDTNKARSAIAPNFIHSHDAMVLHLTVLGMLTPMRLTHDCFATTPGMCEKMRQEITDVYVDLFGDNNLNQIKSLQQDCFNNTGILVELPNNFNENGIPADEIRAAKYKFS